MRPSLSIAVVLSFASLAAGGELTLVRDGKAVAGIVVASDAPKPEHFAAQELSDIIEKMSGARLPITNKLPGNVETLVAIGAGAARLAGRKVLEAARLEDIKNDGYSVGVVADNKPPCLVMAGQEPRGTLYAVYDFLESQCGCGFFPDGDAIPRQATVAVSGTAEAGSPVFRVRTALVFSRFVAPKRFSAALWDEEDWKNYLRWVAKKKHNCLGVILSPVDGSLGAAFDAAFPETRPMRNETLPREVAGRESKYVSRAGWLLHPKYVTDLREKVLAYARETLGLDVLYIVAIGQFEPVLRLTEPKLKWIDPARTEVWPESRDRTACLDMSDPKWHELQLRLLRSVVKTYGRATHYAVTLTSQVAAGQPGAPDASVFAKAIGVVKEADPDAVPFIGTWDATRWGEKSEDKSRFIDALPKGTGVYYWERDFAVPSFHVNLLHAQDTLYHATASFGNRPYAYASPWGGGPSNDMFENRFGFLRNQFRHLDGAYWPKTVEARVAQRRNAIGYVNWNIVRNVNPLVDNLSAEFAWTGLFQWRGEGAYSNPILRRYLGRRYGRSAVYNISKAYKELFRSAPRTEGDANYRAYARTADDLHGNADAARTALTLALACKSTAKDSPFFEKDLVDFGRNYLHQYLSVLHDQVLAQVAAAKEGKLKGDAQKEAQQTVKDLSARILAAHKALTRILATRKDMSLDDAVLEASGTEGANKALDRIAREEQSGLYLGGYCLVDSLEYHSELKAKQIANFLKYAQAQIASPTKDPIPDWRAFFTFGAPEFVEQVKPVPYAEKAEKAAASDILEEYLKTAP